MPRARLEGFKLPIQDIDSLKLVLLRGSRESDVGAAGIDTVVVVIIQRVRIVFVPVMSCNFCFAMN